MNHAYGHDKIKLFVQPYGTKTNPATYTYDNDNGVPVWVENIIYSVAGQAIQFDVVYEPPASDIVTQNLGYNILLQEYQ